MPRTEALKQYSAENSVEFGGTSQFATEWDGSFVGREVTGGISQQDFRFTRIRGRDINAAF